MTTTEELQQLSRDAAGCLPKDFFENWGHPKTLAAAEVGQIPYAYACPPASKAYFCWLHESTEACTEIMVRVLAPLGVFLIGGHQTYIELAVAKENEDCEDYWQEGFTCGTNNDDPMLAFRVAVLRALVALKGK